MLPSSGASFSCFLGSLNPFTPDPRKTQYSPFLFFLSLYLCIYLSIYLSILLQSSELKLGPHTCYGKHSTTMLYLTLHLL